MFNLFKKKKPDKPDKPTEGRVYFIPEEHTEELALLWDAAGGQSGRYYMWKRIVELFPACHHGKWSASWDNALTMRVEENVEP